MPEEFSARFGEEGRKEQIRCLFGKESLRTSNLIRSRGIDLDSIYRRNSLLRFLMTIRNPIDWASSKSEGRAHPRIFRRVARAADSPGGGLCRAARARRVPRGV